MISEETKTILLVEDDILIAAANISMIQSFGYKVIMANSGEEAIDIALGSDSINLILMDIDLGDGIDGTKAAEVILNKYDIPVVFLSSHTEPEIVSKTERITSYGYIVKGSSTTVLSASIKMAFKLFEANRKLKVTKNKLEATLNALPDLLFEVDLNGYFYDYHAPHVDKLYQSDSNIIGKKVSDILPANVTELIISALMEANVKGLCNGVQFYLDMPDGIQWYEISVSRKSGIKDEPRFIVLSRDISERKRVEEALIKAEHRFRDLVDSTVGIVWEADATNFVFSSVSSNAERLLGYAVSDWLEPNFWANHIYSEDRKKALDYCLTCTNRIEDHNFEYRFIAKDGRLVWLRDMVKVITENGKPRWLHGLMIDITEQKQAYEALRESEERFRAIFEQAAIGVAQINSITGDFVFINQKYCDILEYSHEEMSTLNFQAITYPDDLATDLANMKRLIAGEISKFTMEKRYYKKDHSIVWVHLTVSPLWKRGQQPSYHIAVVKDITDRKQSEDKVKDLLAEKELILKEVHHRIKNNMATIYSLLSLQAGASKEPLIIEALNDAENRVQTMMILYDKLYNSTNFKEMSIQAYLSELVTQIVKNFPNSKFVKVEKEIEDFILDANKLSSIGIIINELLTNTMKYAFIDRDSGIISVSALLKENKVLIIIQDNGLGIPESIDLENSNGFGFTLVKMLARQLKGSVKLERDNGTKFLLEFNK